MNETIAAGDVERFREAIGLALGLQVEPGQLASLGDLLQRRLEVSERPVDEYLRFLETVRPANEIAALAQELSIPETYFFRNYDQFRAFREVVLRERSLANAATRQLRILSAGCASGEEAYSIAMLTLDALSPSWQVEILGVDVNPAVVRKAARGTYTAWSLRDTPPEMKRRWFSEQGREFVLKPAVRNAVRFEERNIASPDQRVWQPDSYDVVFLRNVFMYFTPAHQRTVVARAAAALRPGGYLFLGHAETLRGLSADFHLCHTHDTFYYRLKDRPAVADSPAATPAPPPIPATVPVPDIGASESWVEAIARASARIESLASPPLPTLASLLETARPAARNWDLDRALHLLREERLNEALDLMRQLPPESVNDPDVLLLTAALLTHQGQLAEAQQVCQRLLALDDMGAGAHYLLALCREGVRDRSGAVHHDRVAIYLDSSFAMPHLHLGLLARRAGDVQTARAELSQALQLFPREDSARVLLFGGGFGREALIALSRTELASCGGRP
jgi:chemotaxis protein methyltransferase CheR